MGAAERRLAAIMFTDMVGYTAAMGRDEAEGLRLRERHTDLVKETIARFGGEFVSETGDETLTIFSSTVSAVHAAMALQHSLSRDELSIRVGIHVGDIVLRDGRLAGDSINVAARIRPLAAPGQICVSERAHEDIKNQPGIHARSLGPKNFKNVDRPVVVFALESSAPPGAPWRAWLRRTAAALIVLIGVGLLAFPYRHAALGTLFRRGWIPVELPYEKDIRFVTTPDGVRIAYATAGSGPPVVIVRGWFTHLERGANAWVRELMGQHRVVFYDCRGMGLSDGNLTDYSLAARVGDLEAVVGALDLDRFALFGDSAGGPVAIAYTADHPDKVSRLLLYGTYANVNDDVFHRWTLVEAAVRSGWDLDGGPFRQIFEHVFLPDANSLTITAAAALSTIASTRNDALEFIRQGRTFDVRGPAARIAVPTLVVHRRGDQVVPLETSREIASTIPGARLVVLEGRNHLILPGDPQREAFVELIDDFFGGSARS